MSQHRPGSYYGTPCIDYDDNILTLDDDVITFDDDDDVKSYADHRMSQQQRRTLYGVKQK